LIMSVDQGVMLVQNEMTRTLTWIRRKVREMCRRRDRGRTRFTTSWENKLSVVKCSHEFDAMVDLCYNHHDEISFII
jgi:hypothetical protein